MILTALLLTLAQDFHPCYVTDPELPPLAPICGPGPYSPEEWACIAACDALYLNGPAGVTGVNHCYDVWCTLVEDCGDLPDEHHEDCYQKADEVGLKCIEGFYNEHQACVAACCDGAAFTLPTVLTDPAPPRPSLELRRLARG